MESWNLNCKFLILSLFKMSSIIFSLASFVGSPFVISYTGPHWSLFIALPCRVVRWLPLGFLVAVDLYTKSRALTQLVSGCTLVCPGCVLGVSWVCPGCVLGVPRVCPGCVLGVPQMCPGCILMLRHGLWRPWCLSSACTSYDNENLSLVSKLVPFLVYQEGSTVQYLLHSRHTRRLRVLDEPVPFQDHLRTLCFFLVLLQDVPNYILMELSLLTVTDGVVLIGRYLSVRLGFSQHLVLYVCSCSDSAVKCSTHSLCVGCTL